MQVLNAAPGIQIFPIYAKGEGLAPLLGALTSKNQPWKCSMKNKFQNNRTTKCNLDINRSDLFFSSPYVLKRNWE